MPSSLVILRLGFQRMLSSAKSCLGNPSFLRAASRERTHTHTVVSNYCPGCSAGITQHPPRHWGHCRQHLFHGSTRASCTCLIIHQHLLIPSCCTPFVLPQLAPFCILPRPSPSPPTANHLNILCHHLSLSSSTRSCCGLHRASAFSRAVVAARNTRASVRGNFTP